MILKIINLPAIISDQKYNCNLYTCFILLPVSGRVSREGNRIAKELLESLTCPETDGDSVNDNLSSQVITNTEDYNVENNYDDGDLMSAGHDLPIDTSQQDGVSSENSFSIGELSGTKASRINEIDVTKTKATVCNTIPTQNSGQEEKQKEDVRHTSQSHGTTTESSTDTDTPLGFPRHRPSPAEQQLKKNTELAEQNSKRLTEDTKISNSDCVSTANTISSSSYSPAMSLPRLPNDDSSSVHDHPQYGNQSPVVYPSSPGALKNLNVLSRNTSFNQKKRSFSLSSRTSSTVSPIFRQFLDVLHANFENEQSIILEC